MKREKMVYICSPLLAPTKEGIRDNMKKAERYAAIVSEGYHCRTIAPHAFLPEYLDDTVPEEREIGLRFGISILEISKAVIVCGDKISSGMSREIARAMELGLPVLRLVEYPDGRTALKMWGT